MQTWISRVNDTRVRALTLLVLLLASFSAKAQTSYYNQGLLRQGNRDLDLHYLLLWPTDNPTYSPLLGTDMFLLERITPGTPNVTNMFYTTLTDLAAFIGGGVTGPKILTFHNNQNIVEIGSTVNSTVLTWTLGGTAPTLQNINQGIGNVPVGTLTVTDGSSYTVNRTYTLTVSNPDGSDVANTSVSFESKLYYGANVNTSLTDPQILALSQQFATTFVFTKTINVPAGDYLYFAYPSSFGTPATITVNGFLTTAWVIVTRAVVNASGFSTSYDIYRSLNQLSGNYILAVQ